MISPRIAAVSILAASALAMVGCADSSRQPPIFVFPDMRFQGKYKPQHDRPFFSDHRVDQRPVAGTVAVGYLKEDEAYNTGVTANNQYVGKNPEKIDEQLWPWDSRGSIPTVLPAMTARARDEALSVSAQSGFRPT